MRLHVAAVACCRPDQNLRKAHDCDHQACHRAVGHLARGHLQPGARLQPDGPVVRSYRPRRGRDHRLQRQALRPHRLGQGRQSQGRLRLSDHRRRQACCRRQVGRRLDHRSREGPQIQVRRGDHPAGRQAQSHGLRRRQVPERDHDLDPRPGEPAKVHRVGCARARAGSATGSRSRPQSPRRQRAADRRSASRCNPCAGTSTAGGGKSRPAQAGRARGTYGFRQAEEGLQDRVRRDLVRSCRNDGLPSPREGSGGWKPGGRRRPLGFVAAPHPDPPTGRRRALNLGPAIQGGALAGSRLAPGASRARLDSTPAPAAYPA